MTMDTWFVRSRSIIVVVRRWWRLIIDIAVVIVMDISWMLILVRRPIIVVFTIGLRLIELILKNVTIIVKWLRLLWTIVNGIFVCNVSISDYDIVSAVMQRSGDLVVKIGTLDAAVTWPGSWRHVWHVWWHVSRSWSTCELWRLVLIRWRRGKCLTLTMILISTVLM